MKQYWHLILVVALLIGSGCGSKPKAERERISTKSSLKAGDKILYEDDTDMILSLDNDSMVVRRNLTDGTDDTILTTPLELRMSVLSSPEHILVIRYEASSYKMELLSYDIESGRLNSALVEDGLGYMPDFPGERIEVAVVKDMDGALYEASYGIHFDLTESDFYNWGRKVGVTLQKAAEIRRASDGIFGSSNSDGAIYWWQCGLCNNMVKSHSRPPLGGCSARSAFNHQHSWQKGSRAN